jgi:hypothetical protein
MSRLFRNFAAVVAVLLLATIVAWSLGGGTNQPETDFKANEFVERIFVKIDVGAEGDDLAEPIALHLGLGFPLWLHPVGRNAEESPPFGAVPQQAITGTEVRAGESAMFTFEVKGENGQDTYRTTPQLLANLRVSDIASVGFASAGKSNWVLAGYEIKINGKVFASGKGSESVKTAQDAARQKLAEVQPKFETARAEWVELTKLVKTKLATADDQSRLDEMGPSIAALLAQKRKLEGQLEGRYPWFEDGAFRAVGRDQVSVKSARVTVVTAPHTFADTQNYVYFQTGGRKYLLSSPDNPLTGTAGPQRFILDLQAGPLTAADLRGWALGMLGSANPYGTTPDRWHPLRLFVEIDGRVVYDSEESDLDRSSLEAIRLVPPVHKDQEGKLVTNTPLVREAFLWEAGKGLGLDQKGIVVAFPDSDKATYPLPERTDVKSNQDTKPGTGSTELFPGESKLAAGQGAVDPGGDPGSAYRDPRYEDGGTYGGGGSRYEDGGSYGSGGYRDPGYQDGGSYRDPGYADGGGYSGAASQGGGLTFNFNWWINKGVIPKPYGAPPQVQNVRLLPGKWRADHTFTVTWTVSGDERAVAHYQVSLLPIVPHAANPFAGPSIPLGTSPRGTWTVSGTLGALPAGIDVRTLFLAPVVTAIPVDPTVLTPHAPPGPARMIFPTGTSTNADFQPHLGKGPPLGAGGSRFTFLWANPPTPPHAHPLSGYEPPLATARAVWPAGAVESASGTLFEAPPGYGQHVGVRRKMGDTTKVYLYVPKTAFAGAPHNVVAQVGFAGGTGAGGFVKSRMHFQWMKADHTIAGPITYDPPLGFAARQAVGGGPMAPFNHTVNPALAPAAANYLSIRVEISGDAVDPAHPPVLLGVRLVP